MNAPARRVGFFLDDNNATTLNGNGWALFDAAVTWASNKVSMPYFSPWGGTFTSPPSVEILCDTPGAEIRYTTNGELPTSSSTLYSGPLEFSTTTDALRSRVLPRLGAQRDRGRYVHLELRNGRRPGANAEWRQRSGLDHRQHLRRARRDNPLHDRRLESRVLVDRLQRRADLHVDHRAQGAGLPDRLHAQFDRGCHVPCEAAATDVESRVRNLSSGPDGHRHGACRRRHAPLQRGRGRADPTRPHDHVRCCASARLVHPEGQRLASRPITQRFRGGDLRHHRPDHERCGCGRRRVLVGAAPGRHRVWDGATPSQACRSSSTACSASRRSLPEVLRSRSRPMAPCGNAASPCRRSRRFRTSPPLPQVQRTPWRSSRTGLSGRGEPIPMDNWATGRRPTAPHQSRWPTSPTSRLSPWDEAIVSP